jgi:hypothetical protein
MKIRPLRAYAVVSKIKPKFDIIDIFDKNGIKDIRLTKGEQVIKVLITPIK